MMSRTDEIRRLRDEIVSLRDEIRQLRCTIEQERVPMTPHSYPIYPWWPGPYYQPAWWLWWGTGKAICEASDEINGGGTVTYGSMDAQRYSAHLDFPGFCRDYFAGAQERTGTWASDEMLAGVYAHPEVTMPPTHIHSGRAAREAAEGAVAALERLNS
jgi:hypothetical protein